MWEVSKTGRFLKSVKKNDISDSVVDSAESWAQGTSLVVSGRFKRVFVSPNNIFQIWSARLPDPDHNKGSSGGFRLSCIFFPSKNSVDFDLIEKRDKMGFKKERPKDKQKYDAYIASLRKALLGKHEK